MTAAKTPSQFRTGDAVTGIYCGVAFTGKVTDARWNYADYSQTKVSIIFDSPIVLFAGHANEVTREETVISVLETGYSVARYSQPHFVKAI